MTTRIGISKRVLCSQVARRLIGALAPILVSGTQAVASQQPAATTADVSGVVVSAGVGLANASVSILTQKDSVLVAGGLTDKNGKFRIRAIPRGAYIARFTFIGYGTHSSPVLITPTTEKIDLGIVPLIPAPVQLGSVTGETSRDNVQVTVDRTIFHARDVATAAGGNATDVLRHVPSVEVDPDGKISLRGSDNVAIQINGRTAPIRGDALATYLKQLPAAAVDRVEVMPNPSAKYDPEGLSGIVNIVLKQNISMDLSGSVSASLTSSARPSLSGNLGWQRGKVTLFGVYGFSSDRRASDSYTLRQLLFGEVPFSEQQADALVTTHGNTASLNADFQVNPSNTLSSTLTGSLISASQNGITAFTSRDADREQLALVDQSTSAAQELKSFDGVLTFHHAPKPATSDLILEARINSGYNDLLIDFRNVTIPSNSFLIQSTDQNTHEPERTAQLDYMKILHKGWKLESGAKETQRRVNSTMLIAGAFEGDGLGERFEYSEGITAAYALLTHDRTQLAAQAGIRIETARTSFDMLDGTTFKQDHASVFPSASVLLSPSKTQRVRLSYSRRIRRPPSQFLNPVPRFEDEKNQFVGNPTLTAEFTDAIELALVKTGTRGSLQLNPFYRKNHDALRLVKTVDSSDVATTTYRNFASGYSVGADAIASGRIAKNITGSLSASAFKLSTSSSSSGLNGTDAFTWNARTTMAWKINPITDASWLVMYRAPTNVEGGRIDGYTISTIAIQRRVLTRKGTIAFRLSDPLDLTRLSFRTSDALHVQDSWRKQESRVAVLSFTYAFGKPVRLQPRKGSQSETGDDRQIH